ncbi:Aste57867_23031 [Aphanomyces stellatus]|uniref:Aste57867_23031 protein n=1 Tax=Aphanomyces stellatus TaxID=120398 RepID=A0A485LLM8_9STRA|nr:hypothetical protein As57867_022960 [Aphanomyces stellatus]VFT99679.1 Aste57867_23031 [Aphanomyces stellatus]
MTDGPIYSFQAEWFDPQAEISRAYLLTYYEDDGSLEMVDKKSLKPFLKRIKFPSIKSVDLFVGACISVYSRQINLVDTANEYTRRLLASRGSNRVFVVKPSGYGALGRILSALESAKLTFVKMRMIHIQPNDLPLLAKQVDTDAINPSSSASVQEWTRDFSVAIEVSVGSPSAAADALQQLGSLRDHVVTSATSPFLFDHTRFGTTAASDDCSTLCLVRPRVLKEGLTCCRQHVPTLTLGKAGQVLGEILHAGFEVSAVKLVHVPMAAMDEFLAIYKPVTRQYHELVKYMSSAPLLALEIRGEDVVARFQAFCGPFDVQVARELAPASLRARYGHTNMQNAVHCSDCPEDGALESQFFFRVLP